MLWTSFEGNFEAHHARVRRYLKHTARRGMEKVVLERFTILQTLRFLGRFCSSRPGSAVRIHIGDAVYVVGKSLALSLRTYFDNKEASGLVRCGLYSFRGKLRKTAISVDGEHRVCKAFSILDVDACATNAFRSEQRLHFPHHLRAASDVQLADRTFGHITKFVIVNGTLDRSLNVVLALL